MSLPDFTPHIEVGSANRRGYGNLKREAVGTSSRGFRPDIDGLRAIAIVLVVLSHSGLRKAVGGFVGVDIFFVISGYLLTGNIAHGIAAGKFSVAGFYERRIRRIVPALVAMLVATSVLAFVVFPSKALELFGESLLAALFSYSNFYFFTQSGYFSITYTKLLLHTWSLGVEEQFYLALPLCMLWAAGGPVNATRRLVALLGIASFACAAYLTLSDRNLAFYMPYTRAWELLLGSALALRMLPSPAARWLREVMAALSILLILGCLFAYTELTPFPGVAALAPCVAAAMLISIGEQGSTTISSFLSWRPMMFIGAISYSLYLWHWPVMLFFRLGIVPKLEYGIIRGLPMLSVLLSIALATVSWRFVEQPFRTGRWRSMQRQQIFQIAGVVAAAVAMIAVTFIASKGLPDRFPAAANTVADYLFGDSTRRPGCFVETSFAAFDARRCLAQAAGKKNVLLLGDSHADALWFGLSQSLSGANVLQATGSSCPPVKGHYDGSPCGSLRRLVYDDYLPTHHVDAVILTEAWKSLADFDALEQALRWFRNRRIPIFVIGPVPEYTAPLPLLLAFGEKWHLHALAGDRLVRRFGLLDRELRLKVEGWPGVRYGSVWRAVCPADHCMEYVDRNKGIPILFDESHLTSEGASLAIRRMQAAGELPL